MLGLGNTNGNDEDESQDVFQGFSFAREDYQV